MASFLQDQQGKAPHLLVMSRFPHGIGPRMFYLSLAGNRVRVMVNRLILGRTQRGSRCELVHGVTDLFFLWMKCIGTLALLAPILAQDARLSQEFWGGAFHVSGEQTQSFRKGTGRTPQPPPPHLARRRSRPSATRKSWRRRILGAAPGEGTGGREAGVVPRGGRLLRPCG